MLQFLIFMCCRQKYDTCFNCNDRLSLSRDYFYFEKHFNDLFDPYCKYIVDFIISVVK